MTAPLLTTKLYLPPARPNRVPRPQLLQRLTEGHDSGRPLTLVSAPAGFGKTTCISEWVNTLDEPVAWLSLDRSDDDPGHFFTYLVAALQTVDAALGREIEGVLRSGQLPPAEIVLTTLIDDILQLDERFVLVLDDFQEIQDGFILQVLEKLVTHPPRPLHLVILTREDPALPLARLRAGNLLTELRAGDLRFTSREADRFLNEAMGLSLSPADITLLEDKTEGWVAGLHLAGLSIRDQADPSGFIAGLSGSHRLILSYLTEEVLSRQPEAVQQFLLQTSILDRLNGELCNAVGERTDSHWLLNQLLSANLFLLPLDDEGHWYRYHPLFADLLRDVQNTLHKENTAGLHQRASRWYARAGMASEAVRHALAAQDYALAMSLIESYTLDMLMQWHNKTVEGWMQAIPLEWRSRSPKANLAYAWLHLLRGAYPQAAPYLERLQTIFSSPQAETDSALQAEWLALQATLLSAQGKPLESLELGRQALAIVPQAEGHVRSRIYLGLASAYQQLEDFAHAAEAFQMLIQHGQAAANPVSELLGVSALALMAIERGQLHFAFQIASQGIDQIERSGSLPAVSTAVYGELGVIHYQWHELKQAHKYFQRAIQVSALTGYSDAELYYGVILSRLLQIEGDLEAAARELQKAVDRMQVVAPTVVREEVVSQQVRIYLAQHRLAAAEAILKTHGFTFQGDFSYPGLGPGHTVTRPVGVLYLSALRILLYRAQAGREPASLKPGIDLAGRLIDAALQRQYIPFVLETLLLRAQMQAALGNGSASRADYARALQLAEPEGFVSIFLEGGPPVAGALASLLEHNRLGTVQPEYVRQILAAFPVDGRPGASPPPATAIASETLIDPLSERELEILRLIGEGCSNQAIAEQLVVTLHTVKKHTSNIYAKLGVGSRTQALARARQLKLL